MIPPVTHASYLDYLLIALLLGPGFYFIYRARKGQEFKIRRIAGIDAIEEGIGRATEMGRPIVFSTGLTGLNALLFAILGILSYIARRAALLNTKLLVPQSDYEVMPVVEDVVREAYRAEGRLDAFNPEDIRFLSPSQFAFASGYMGIVHREQAATCFLFGAFAAESLILAEAGQQVGALQVAGTPSNEQIPFFLTSCDYTLIGEEVYAAGAYLSHDPNQVGGLRGQDFSKLGILALIGLGLATALFLSVYWGDSKEGTKFSSPYAQAFYVKPEWERCVARFSTQVVYQPSLAPDFPDLDRSLAKTFAHLPQELGRLDRSLTRLRQRLQDARAELANHPGGQAGPSVRKDLDDLLKWFDDVTASVAASRDQFRALPPRIQTITAQAERSATRRLIALVRPVVEKYRDWAAEPVPTGDADTLTRATALLQQFDQPAGVAVKKLRRETKTFLEQANRIYYRRARERVERLRAEAAEGRFPAGQGAIRFDAISKGPAVFNSAHAVDGNSDSLRYEWDFGDGTQANQLVAQPPSQVDLVFKSLGEKNVSLTVTDATPKKSLSLDMQPTTDSAVRREDLKQGTEVSFSWTLPTDAVTNSATLSWDFGDGTKIETRKPSAVHSYDQVGTFHMRVEVKYTRTVEKKADEEFVGKKESGAGGGENPALLRLRSAVEGNLREVNEALADVAKKAEAAARRLATAVKAAQGSPEPFSEDVKLLTDAQEFRGNLSGWLKPADAFAVGRRATIEAFGRAQVGDDGAATAKASKKIELIEVRQILKIHWNVVAPNRHTFDKTFAVTEALAKAEVALPWEGAFSVEEKATEEAAP